MFLGISQNSQQNMCLSLFFNKAATLPSLYLTVQEMKFPIKDFSSKCDCSKKLGIWSHLLGKSLMENFNFLGSVSVFDTGQLKNLIGLIIKSDMHKSLSNKMSGGWPFYQTC